jgi:hypothetical protein
MPAIRIFLSHRTPPDQNRRFNSQCASRAQGGAGNTRRGFAASDADEMADHLLAVFALDTDTAPDGTAHVEAARDSPAAPRRCLCGYGADDLDRHFLSVFTPDSATAIDGTRHVSLP